MAKVKITGHQSGSGVITVTAPNTSTDRTITLPDGDVTLGAATPSITDGGNATAITITSAERIGINHTTPEARLEIHGGNETGLMVVSGVAGEYPAIFQSASTGSVPILSLRNNSGVGPLEVLSDGRGLSQFTAKAWVNYKGTDTVAIRDSHNVSSVTDRGAGQYTVNFDVDMANAQYCALTGQTALTIGNSDNRWSQRITDVATGHTSIVMTNFANGFNYEDAGHIFLAVFGD